MDKYFRVEVLSQTPKPQQAIYLAMHQDYDEGFVWDEMMIQQETDCSASEEKWIDTKFTESWCGESVVKNLLKGGRGHYGPLEHPQIVLNCGWFPHSTMQQVRTHRVGVSFDCQSFRYSGSRICDVALGRRDVEEVFYLRPVDEYTDRQGKKYEYTEDERNRDLDWCFQGAQRYWYKISLGFSEEHARGLIPFDVRQHWVMSANVRSLMHLLDLRWKKDAQLECQQLCELIWPHFKDWVPHVADWYEENRKGKARLAP